MCVGMPVCVCLSYGCGYGTVKPFRRTYAIVRIAALQKFDSSEAFTNKYKRCVQLLPFDIFNL